MNRRSSCAFPALWAWGMGIGLFAVGCCLTPSSPPASQVSTPEFAPLERMFSPSVDVTITCFTAAATIRYTIDGTTPTAATGTVYTTPIHLTNTTTIKAIACKDGMTDSSVTFATYVRQAEQPSPDPNDPNDPNNTLALFDKVWRQFNENYSHFPAKAALGVDWDVLRTEYRPQFTAKLTTPEFLNRLAPMLAQLQDLHVTLFDPNGQPVPTYSRPAEQNWLGGYLPAVFPNGVSKLSGKYPLRHGWLEPNIAYMSIESFSGDAWQGLKTSELNELFQTYAGAIGFIVDVRQNSGGSEEVARAIAGYFTDEPITYGRTRDRIVGSDRDAFADFHAHVLQPADQYRFLKPTAVLIGQKNMSSAEWFVLMMAGCPDTRLMGDLTRGSSGNPLAENAQEQFALSNGVYYWIPSWEAYQSDGVTPIEDVGIEPQDWVDADESYSEEDQRDYLIEWAIAWIRWG